MNETAATIDDIAGIDVRDDITILRARRQVHTRHDDASKADTAKSLATAVDVWSAIRAEHTRTLYAIIHGESVAREWVQRLREVADETRNTIHRLMTAC